LGVKFSNGGDITGKGDFKEHFLMGNLICRLIKDEVELDFLPQYPY
jgi:hypothetical protein